MELCTRSSFLKYIVRSKGLFWLASRPEQALIWGQAGGSLRAESAGVWWASMPFEERMQYPPFVHNQEEIESEWDFNFGDRKNEIVFIGQDMDEALIKANLNACLMDEEELLEYDLEMGYEDDWPVQRMDY